MKGNTERDHVPPILPPFPSPIVGIGASAGGLDALERFFAHLPADTPVAVVVVQHLHAGYPSSMPELLAKHAHIPVRQAEDEARVEPGNAYLIPPNAALTIEKGTLRVVTPAEPRRALIDQFFCSLAVDQGHNAVGIVLSGAGTDGTLGLKAIKEQGGLTIAQTIESAKYDSMPRSAISLGFVDYTLPVDEMPAKLIEYAEQLAALPRSTEEPEHGSGEFADKLGTICAILRCRTGHDFSKYKQTTLLRRIQRRMLVTRVLSGAKYVGLLRANPDEVHKLFRDLLIGVTQFFRDPDAFATLSSVVLPRILESRHEDRELRVWVPGCASGEEAYSIAILLREAMEALDGSPLVKIFATDIDEHAVDVARLGRYTEGIAETVSKERLERFFTKQGGAYQIDKSIREMCIFSLHNLISDPPFSRLNLISCRNLLIYLEADLQRRLLPVFHYALRSSGYLLLGPSESIPTSSELFRTVDKKLRLFQKNNAVIPSIVSFPIVGPGRAPMHALDAAARSPAGRAQDISETFERVLLENYSPSAVVINEKGDIIYTSGRTGKYLELSAGVANVNVIDMARKGLRSDLHTAIHRAVKTRQEVFHEDVSVEVNDYIQRINLSVRPLSELEPSSGLFMVVFRDLGPLVTKEQASAVGSSPRTEDQLVQTLAGELRSTKEHLRTTIEGFETSNEKLKSANEELLSINEELQSTNEELQTSKEELQSINEELQTVNGELSRKVEELDRTHSDLQNLFANANVATLFLDNALRIKKFSPEATEVFQIIPSDIGRPITDIAATFADGDLIDNLREVLRSLLPREQQVRRLDRDQWYIERIRPYRSLDNVIGGVVLTFVDITNLKRAEQRIKHLAALVVELGAVREKFDAERTRLQTLVDHVPFGVALAEMPGPRVILENSRAQELLKYLPFSSPNAEPEDDSGLYRADGRPIAVSDCPLSRSLRGEIIYGEDYLYQPGPGELAWIRLSAAPLHGRDGKVTGSVFAFTDVDKEKRAEQKLQELDRRKNEFLAMLGHELRNPLTPIRNAAHILRRIQRAEPKVHKAVDMIERQVTHMVRLIDDLLDVSRISTGKILLQLEPVDLVGVIRAAQHDHFADLATHKLSLHLIVPSEPVWVKGDPVRLSQVVMNLVYNAIKFTDAGGHITVELTAEPGGDVALLRIRDTGIGMTEETLGRIFEPFAQADRSLDRSHGGLGLGLSLIKGLVELHGGAVKAMSEGLEQGSEFTVSLPLMAPPEARSEVNPRETEGAEARTEARQRRVLLVEDNVDISDSIKLFLESLGHEVAVAYTGADGVEMARSFCPEVILCDIGLPGTMTGYDVAKALRDDALASSAHRIALTGYGQNEDQRRAFEAGFEKHLTKPVAPDTLQRLLQNLS